MYHIMVTKKVVLGDLYSFYTICKKPDISGCTHGSIFLGVLHIPSKSEYIYIHSSIHIYIYTYVYIHIHIDRFDSIFTCFRTPQLNTPWSVLPSLRSHFQDLLDIEDNPVHLGNEIGSLVARRKFCIKQLYTNHLGMVCRTYIW